MPYIALHTDAVLAFEQQERIKAQLGQMMTMLAGKREELLMVEFAGGHPLYLGGRLLTPGAYLDVKVFGAADREEKKAFVAAVNQLLLAELAIPAESIYLTWTEFDSWGTGGQLRC